MSVLQRVRTECGIVDDFPTRPEAAGSGSEEMRRGWQLQLEGNGIEDGPGNPRFGLIF
jgi:hypothetical protein